MVVVYECGKRLRIAFQIPALCGMYPSLADFAVDLLVVPCTSSASETLFSHVGILSSGLRNRVSVENLENQVLLQSNYKLLL